jgi:uncharacterized membrane protein YcaP (DUF421 family)
MIDWRAVFVPTVHPLELILRGSIIYLLILVGLRLFRREAGALSMADLLVIVLVADAAQNAMGSDYKSIPEGAILVATIFAWNWVLDWLAFKSRRFHRLLHPPPLELVRDGKVNRRNLRKEMMTMGDLSEQLREHGVENHAEVKRCYLESDGHLSVIKADGTDPEKPKAKPVGS